MANGYKIDVSGALKSFDKLVKDIIQGIDDELDENAEIIADNARADVPKGLSGGLMLSISVVREKKLERSVVASKFYAPFVEFGTGPYAQAYTETLPTELQAYAMTFFVTGLGHMPPAPFMFPNVFRQIPIIEQAIVNVINDL